MGKQLIVLLLVYLILGFIVATLGLCFEHFMKPNMIFNGYYKWLERKARKSKFWKHITKPLGLCVYCNSSWIAIGVFIYYFKFNITILLFIGIVWFFIDIYKNIKNE